MHARRLLLTLALCAGLLASAGAGATTAALGAAPGWTRAANAAIRPGVTVDTPSGGCTSNFIFFRPQVRPDGRATRSDVYIGLAAHCYSLGDPSETNGCTTPSRPLGTRTTVAGARHPAKLVYSSWLAMQAVRERSANACAVNDFAVAKLDRRDHARVNPSVLHFGGPSGLRTTRTAVGDELYTYGNSSLRFGLKPILPKWGYSTGMTNSGWSHRVYTITPGVPGDSGSGMLDAQGRAMGVVVTLAAAPFPMSNGVTDMSHALRYLRSHTGWDLRLAKGTVPFTPKKVPPLAAP